MFCPYLGCKKAPSCVPGGARRPPPVFLSIPREPVGTHLCFIYTWGARRLHLCFIHTWGARRPPPVFYPYLGIQKASTCVSSIPGEPEGLHLCFIHTWGARRPPPVFYPYLGSQKASSSTKDSHQPKEVRKRPTGRAQGLSVNRSCSKTRCEDINFVQCTKN